jgi:hypothetical protein
MGNFMDYPSSKWSNAAIAYLRASQAEFVTIFLEDYWLIRNVNLGGIKIGLEMMRSNPNIARFDLTTDRLYGGELYEVTHKGEFDVFESLAADYRFSLQTAIWRRTALLDLLVPDESPWQVEIEGTARMVKSNWLVYGTRQWPVCYQIMVDKGTFKNNGDWMFPKRQLEKKDLIELEMLKYDQI